MAPGRPHCRRCVWLPCGITLPFADALNSHYALRWRCQHYPLPRRPLRTPTPRAMPHRIHVPAHACGDHRTFSLEAPRVQGATHRLWDAVHRRAAAVPRVHGGHRGEEEQNCRRSGRDHRSARGAHAVEGDGTCLQRGGRVGGRRRGTQYRTRGLWSRSHRFSFALTSRHPIYR